MKFQHKFVTYGLSLLLRFFYCGEISVLSPRDRVGRTETFDLFLQLSRHFDGDPRSFSFHPLQRGVGGVAHVADRFVAPHVDERFDGVAGAHVAERDARRLTDETIGIFIFLNKHWTM